MDELILHRLNELCRSVTAVELGALALSSRWFGVGVLAVVLVVLVRRWRPRWLVVAMLAGAVILTDVTGHYVLKPLVARPRPCHAFTGLHTPAGCGGRWSMPSNHAGNAFAGAAVATLLAPAGAPLYYLVAAAVSLSRVLVGVHYLSDVLAGAAVGTVIGLGVGGLGWRRLRAVSRARLAA